MTILSNIIDICVQFYFINQFARKQNLEFIGKANQSFLNHAINHAINQSINNWSHSAAYPLRLFYPLFYYLYWFALISFDINICVNISIFVYWIHVFIDRFHVTRILPSLPRIHFAILYCFFLILWRLIKIIQIIIIIIIRYHFAKIYSFIHSIHCRSLVVSPRQNSLELNCILANRNFTNFS